MTLTTQLSSLKLNAHELKIRSMIGEGGQGTIFSARNVGDDTSLAVKMVDISSINSKINFRAEQEAIQIIKPWKLKYLCDIYEYTEKEDIGYVLMERYNCDLFDHAVVKRGLSEDAGRIIFRKLVTGLMNLHSIGVAHLDIKSENIMMDLATNSPFIGDFGSCYIFKDKKLCPLKRGTKQYYPPEFASKDPFDPVKVDIYCLGVTLHTILTGYFPYNTAEPLESRTIHISSKLSEECANLIAKMLHPKPKKRISLKKIQNHPWVLVPGEVVIRSGGRSRLTKKAKDGLCWSLQRFYN